MNAIYVQHKSNMEVFGVVETIGGIQYFKKTKYEQINQNKPFPKITSRQFGDNLKFREQLEKGVIKKIDSDFFNHFNKISYSEFCYLDMISFYEI